MKFKCAKCNEEFDYILKPFESKEINCPCCKGRVVIESAVIEEEKA